jgi:hypothetical protein
MVFDIAIDQSGVKWFATSSGLARFDDLSWMIYDHNDWPSIGSYVEAVAVGPDGVIYAGVSSRLAVYRDSAWTVYDDSNSTIETGSIYDIQIREPGDIWIAQALQGVHRFRPEGAAVSVGEGARSSVLPRPFDLHQNYPNPFNPSTSIGFTLAIAGAVSLKIYDVQGREVLTVVEGTFPAGEYSYTVEANRLAGGAYFYRLTSGGRSQTRKLLLLN